MPEASEAFPVISKVANATLRTDRLGDFSRTRDGMIWVGGRITLGSERLMFSANRLNRLVNRPVLGDYYAIMMDFGIGLDGDFKMRVHSTFVTQTIELILSDGMQIGLRCWGAGKIAEEITARRERLRGAAGGAGAAPAA